MDSQNRNFVDICENLGFTESWLSRIIRTTFLSGRFVARTGDREIFNDLMLLLLGKRGG